MSNITDKEWLDLTWKYFQQHAQQRISYFNFFVIFSTILTTGLVSTFQKAFGVPYLGVAIGVIQVFLSFMFWKIDQRNKFLTKHAEEIIKSIESKSELGSDLVFTAEETKSAQQFELDKKANFLKRLITHGRSYEIIYFFFCAWGIAGIVISSMVSTSNGEIESTKVEASVYLKYEKVDSLKDAIHRRDSVTDLLFKNLKELSSEIDSLQMISRSYKEQPSR